MKQSLSKKGWQYAILGFAVLGFLIQLINSTMSILLPIIVIGVIYYLYKSPPRWLIKLSSSSKPFTFARSNQSKKSTKKKHPFRVIDGNKKNKPF